MKRRKMSRKSSRNDFRRKADLIHKKNSLTGQMRGGIRL